jgi:hypothetical protein
MLDYIETAVTDITKFIDENIVDLGDIIGNSNSKKKKVELPPLPYRNILHLYSSYNYIFTLSILDKYQVSHPDETYKKGDVGQIILKSGSGSPLDRVDLGSGIGSFEFFIDDVNIESIVAFNSSTGNSMATSISFKIIEPYSMGMFFNALKVASNNAGYGSYINASTLLTVEFMGHISSMFQGVSGDSLSSIEKTTRHYPLRIISANMKVTGSGSEYECTAVPWNETAFSSKYTEMMTDISIYGDSVHKLLQSGPKSLEYVLNHRLEEQMKKDNLKDRDYVLILFPTDPTSSAESSESGESGESGNENSESSATVDPSTTQSSGKDVLSKLKVTIKTVEEGGTEMPVQDPADINSLGLASMNFELYNTDEQPFPKDDFVYDEKTNTFTRGNVIFNPTQKEMKFNQGVSIIDVINQVLIMSDYGRQALQQAQVKDGMIQWWSIQPLLYPLEPRKKDGQQSVGKTTGRDCMLRVYRIVPYKVSASNFLPPNSANPNIEQDKLRAVKEYDYIYTGENLDIIDFNIQYDLAFYQSLMAGAPQQTGDNMNNIRDIVESTPDDGKKKEEDTSPFNVLANKIFKVDELKAAGEEIVSYFKDKTSTTNSVKGGSRIVSPTNLLVKQAHDILLNGVDMLSPTIKILGDPYYLADSGMGNYTSTESNHDNINADHSMNYQSGEVDIVVNFRTPLDIDHSVGKYNFGPTQILEQFSGLYRVNQCTSHFSRGKFTQELQLLRRPGQIQAPNQEG